MAGTIYTVDQAAAAITSGAKANINTTAVPLVATPTPCKRVRLIAPVDANGAALNSLPVFVGDANAQPDWIAADGSRDRIIHIDDASKIYVKAGNATDDLNYLIEN